MKLRITDLLDHYEDRSDLLRRDADLRNAEGLQGEPKEMIPLKVETKRFGWKQGLSIAAAVAVVVAGGFGVKRMLDRQQAKNIEGSEAVSTVTLPSPDKETELPTETDSTPVELTPELQAKANTFLTWFAEQGITELDPQNADTYTLVSFAHLWYKINQRDAIEYRAADEGSYETLTLAQVNDLLDRLMDTTVEVPEGTDFTEQRGDNYALHEVYRDGRFWFPAAEGDQHNAFAVCEAIRYNTDGTMTLEYRVYEPVDPWSWDVDLTDKAALFSGLTVRDADKNEALQIVMCGAAVVRTDPDQNDGFCLHYLHASWVDQSVHTDDPDGILESAEMRQSFNTLLSRFAEQDVADLEELKTDDAALMNFAHNLAKLHPDAGFPIEKQSREGADYDTMPLDSVNEILTQMVGASVNPSDGTEFTSPLHSDSHAVGFVDNGVVWFPEGDGYTYPCFAVCTKAEYKEHLEENGYDYGAILVEFNVYEVSLEDYASGKVGEYCRLTVEEAEALAAQKAFYLTEKGTAVIMPAGGGGMMEYTRTWVEPEGWEEEFPQEYPVTEWRIEGEGFLQSGEINLYRYEQLPEAEGYVDILTGIARQALNSPDADFAIDSPHDGYANWFMTTSNGSASVSGSSITGRFTYSLYPGFDRILEQSGAEITDRDAMEQAARSFAEQFSGITGELELVGTRDDEEHYHDERFTSLRDVVVPSVIFYFRSADNSKVTLQAQDGLEVPVSCGDSTLDDLTDHTFAVTVWPDGTVVDGNNYITRAEIVPNGTLDMPGEESMDAILSFMTSYTEDDTFILESAALEEYSVYFGYGSIDPVLTIRYHYASTPDEHEATLIVIPGLLD